MSFNSNDIRFTDPQPELFSDIADNAAYDIRSGGENVNKSTQLRKFYDELVMWHDKITTSSDSDKSYKDNEIYIKMLKAKVAYAEARKLVNEKFTEIFNGVIDQIKDVKTLKMAKLFMEAVMGYCKYYEAKK